MANWLVFAGLGPPLGLASLIVFIALTEGGVPFETLATVVMVGLPACYLFGLVPALASAFAIRQVQIRQIGPEGIWVVLIGISVGAVYVIATSRLLGEDLVELGMGAVTAHLLACFMPTLICWWLSRRFAMDRASEP